MIKYSLEWIEKRQQRLDELRKSNNMAGQGQITNNFHIREMKCKDGTEVPAHLLPNAIKVLQQLQVLRDYLGEPIHINSGYRTPEYNRRIGGARLSQHILANAADITTKNKTPKQLSLIVEKLIKEGKLKFKGLGIYAGFIHCDLRRNRTRWGIGYQTSRNE